MPNAYTHPSGKKKGNQVNHLIPATSPFDAIKRTDEHGEHWTGRDLMTVMDYANWREFATVIEKAKASLAIVQGSDQAGHHLVMSPSDGGRWGNQKLDDYRLTRFGAYLVAMAGDDTKQAVAEARIYFAVQTRRAEIAEAPRLTEVEVAERWLAALKREQVLEAKVAELAPKAESWDMLMSADGDYLMGDAAKILCRDPRIQVGERRLFSVLAQQKWIYRQRGDRQWRPYQAAIECGRLLPLPQTHYHRRTGELVLDPPQVRVTIKGLADLHRLLGGARALSLQQQLPLGWQVLRGGGAA